jgi:TRAP-type mannitol/chloroaromatic compound transport system permease large subunit
MINKHLDKDILQEVMRDTTRITSMVFMILIGAALFSLVFRGFEGDELPTAPTEAASVGVARPPTIDPSTANININGGNKLLATRQ